MEVLNNRDGAHQGAASAWSCPPAGRRNRRRHPFGFARAGGAQRLRFGVAVPAAGEPRLRDDGGGHGGGQGVPRGLRVDRSIATSRRATSIGPRPARCAAVDVQVAAGPQRGLRDGRRRPGAGRRSRSSGRRWSCSTRRRWPPATLAQFDAIVTGTRAYAVREDLRAYNQRLLDYVKNGGNLIVLYNTQELVPGGHAPFPAKLPQRRRGGVRGGLAGRPSWPPAHQVFNWPNRITPQDFDGWVEQRGSKFWTEWDPAYTPSSQPTTAARRPSTAAGCTRARQGPLLLLRLRLPSPAPLRRARRLPPPGQSALPEQGGRGQSTRAEAAARAIHANTSKVVVRARAESGNQKTPSLVTRLAATPITLPCHRTSSAPLWGASGGEGKRLWADRAL